MNKDAINNRVISKIVPSSGENILTWDNIVAVLELYPTGLSNRDIAECIGDCSFTTLTVMTKLMYESGRIARYYQATRPIYYPLSAANLTVKEGASS